MHLGLAAVVACRSLDHPHLRIREVVVVEAVAVVRQRCPGEGVAAEEEEVHPHSCSLEEGEGVVVVVHPQSCSLEEVEVGEGVQVV